MRLLIDEDSQARTLVRRLQEAGHDVLTAEAAGLNSRVDAQVLQRAVLQRAGEERAVEERAVAERRILLTRNCGDFLALHRENAAHPGILAVHQDADPSKDMSYADIVQSIANLVAARVPIAGEFVVLNAWNW